MDPRQSPAQHHQPHQPHHPPNYPNPSPNPGSNSASPFPPHHPHQPPHHHQQQHGQGPAYSSPHPSAAPHHQRRPSDTPYYPSSSRHFPTEPAHSRAQSASSLPSARELSRAMPPPNSPPQVGAQQPPGHQHQQQQQSHSAMGYAPPPPRAPPVAVGPPTAFPGGRELPSLGSLARASSAGGSSMSISSMLGGPPAASRDSQPPPSHYPPHSSAPGSGPGFAQSVHASPRMQSASGEYPPFRRPQTPEHQRPYEPRGSAAASPHGHYSTPEVQRYGTPQTYHSRHPSASADQSRDGRMSAGPPPPRPSSQPKSYPGMPPRPMDMGRPGPEDAYGRREEPPRGPAPGPEYNPERTALRPNPFDDRYRAERERERERERDRQQNEAEHWERERRERAYSGSDSGRHPLPPHDLGYRDPLRNQPYNLPPPDGRERRDPREASWGRPASDPSYRAPMDQPRHPDYPPVSAPYPQQSQGYPTAQADRYAPSSHPHPQGSSAAPPPYDSPDRARMSQLHPQQQQPPHRRNDDAMPPSGAYNPAHGLSPFDASRARPGEDPIGPSSHQRNLLAIQDISRTKGRVSPLPQAVQGAQPQQPGPAAEPGIKSEFGRMFSGIGSGVSGIGVSSPITSAPAVPYSNPGLPKRDDDGVPESGPDGSGKGAKGRRRKLKEEDSRGDDDSSGRLTPNKSKRAKAHHHHQFVPLDSPGVLQTNNQSSHHHHHHHHANEGTSPTIGIAALKSLKGGGAAPSPTDKNAQGHHHHHHHHHHVPRSQPQQPGQKPPTQSPPVVIPPKTKTMVSSQAVLDAVSNRPRHHLGDFIYEPGLKAGRLLPNNPTHRGFSSNPKPLPWDVIKGKENCLLTVKVPRVNLTTVAREEITSRSYLWGTEVYTDDSDVVAACIHSGWIKGEWGLDVDAALLTIDQSSDTKRRKKAQPVKVDIDSEDPISTAPATPMLVPADRDLHINILILPRLVRYSSVTRFGMTSREFGGEFGGRHVVHDGLSFMIKSIRWVSNGAQPQARLRGQARRERMRKAMQEVKGSSAGNVSGLEREQERERLGRLRGSEISGNWWKKEQREKAQQELQPEGTEKTADKGDDKDELPERGASEGDKENRLADDEGKDDVDAENTMDVSGVSTVEEKTGDADVEMAEGEATKEVVEAEK